MENIVFLRILYISVYLRVYVILFIICVCVFWKIVFLLFMLGLIFLIVGVKYGDRTDIVYWCSVKFEVIGYSNLY